MSNTAAVESPRFSHFENEDFSLSTLSMHRELKHEVGSVASHGLEVPFKRLTFDSFAGVGTIRRLCGA